MNINERDKLAPYVGPWQVILGNDEIVHIELNQDQAISLAKSNSADNAIICIDAQNCTVKVIERQLVADSSLEMPTSQNNGTTCSIVRT